jgi:signal transduction histidine kinase
MPSSETLNQAGAGAGRGQDAQTTLQIFNIAGRMAGAAAHDFNNILTGILGNLELMQRRASRGGITEFNDYITGARSAASRGVEYAQNLLAIAGHQPLEPVPISASGFIETIAGLITTSIAGKAALATSCPASAQAVFCDETKLAEALLELARNAVGAGATSLVITAAPALLDDRQAGRHAVAPGAYIAFTMTDNGRGLSDDAAVRGFEPFYSSHNAPGLGLPKILGFARQSGGHAFIASRQPGNTAITLLLPTAA